MTQPNTRTSARERFAQVLDHLTRLQDNLADDTDRIELDLFFSDGVRAKVEIRNLEREG